MYLESQLPFHRWWVAASSAPAPLAPGHDPAGVPPFVIAPETPCTTVAGSSVLVRPSIRTVTAGPLAAPATPDSARASAIVAPPTARMYLRCMGEPPLSARV